jgi:putative restriction endonuclease
VLAKYRCKCNRLISYHEIDYTLSKLAKRYFPEIKVFNANYPFWRLQNDNLWEVTNKELLPHQHSKSDISRLELLKHNVCGGFNKPIYTTIISENLFGTLIRMVAEYLPVNIRNNIFNDLGLSAISDENWQEQSNPQDFLELFIQEYFDENILLSD